MSTEIDDSLIDVTDFYVMLCAEEGFVPHGERFIVPRKKWDYWQANLLKEYFSDDRTHDGANSES
jgi:hypothetical protein